MQNGAYVADRSCRRCKMVLVRPIRPLKPAIWCKFVLMKPDEPHCGTPQRSLSTLLHLSDLYSPRNQPLSTKLALCPGRPASSARIHSSTISSRRLSRPNPRPNGRTAAPVREHSVRGDISLPAEGLKIEGQWPNAAFYERLKNQRARCTAAGGHYVHNCACGPDPPLKTRDLVHICAYVA